MLTVYFAATPPRWRDFEAPLQDAFAAAGLAVGLSAECDDPAAVDYLIYAPNGPVQDFAPFTRAKAVLSLWAGVERIVNNPTLTQPLCRMVDDGLRAGMVEYVTGHVLRHHLGIDRFLLPRPWKQVVPPLARNRPVTILGLGELGRACADALSTLGFPVRGWSRRPQDHPSCACFHGAGGLERSLRDAQIVVLLLPETPQTADILNAHTLSLLAPGAFVLNPGRGTLIDDDALLAALDASQVAHATLDTFRVEPLPAEHPFWQHPRVTVTPHVASETRPETAAPVIAHNIARAERGDPLLHLVDRAAGY